MTDILPNPDSVGGVVSSPVTFDHNLWNRAHAIKDGSNCHDLCNLLTCYSGWFYMLEQVSMSSERYKERFQSAETKLRHFVIGEEFKIRDAKFKEVSRFFKSRKDLDFL